MNVGLIKSVGQKVLVGTGLAVGSLAVALPVSGLISLGYKESINSLANLGNIKLPKQPQADTFQKTNV